MLDLSEVEERWGGTAWWCVHLELLRINIPDVQLEACVHMTDRGLVNPAKGFELPRYIDDPTKVWLIARRHYAGNVYEYRLPISINVIEDNDRRGAVRQAVKATALEIYRGMLNDLLSPTPAARPRVPTHHNHPSV